MKIRQVFAWVGVCVAVTAFAHARAATAAADGVLIDVTKNPGCNVKLSDKAEKIARNRRLAEYYFTGYLYSQQAKHGKHYGWRDFDCFADDATMRMGFGLEPKSPRSFVSPKRPPPDQDGSKDMAQAEMDAVHDAYPDFGTLPGTFSVFPSENAVYFVFGLGGTDKDGKRLEYWETDFVAVSDEGKITHWDAYNDTMAVDRLFKRMFGKGVDEIGTLAEYGKLLQERARQGRPSHGN